MTLGEFINIMNKLKDKYGESIPVYCWDDTYLEEFEIKKSDITFRKSGQNKKRSNIILPDRICIG